MPPEHGTSRREELLTVATKLFAARGYHGTRMDDVADVVGLNKATVYHYYASKSPILFDIYRRGRPHLWPPSTTTPPGRPRSAVPVHRATPHPDRGNPEGAAVYFQEQPYITEWFTEEQVAEVREKGNPGLRTRTG